MKYLFVYILSILIFATSCSKNNFDLKLKEYKLPATFEGYFELAQFSDEPVIMIGENAENGNILKLKILPLTTSMGIHDLVKNQLARTISNYQYSSAPYPGQMTQIIGCGTKRRPTLNYSGDFSYMSLYGRDRLGLVICDSDQYTHMSYTSFYLDEKSNRIVEVEFRQVKRDQSDQYLDFLKNKLSRLKPISLKPYEEMFKFN